jgi:hypothetical protein
MTEPAGVYVDQSPRLQVLMVVGCALAVGGSLYLLVVGFAFLMGLAFTSPTPIIASVLITAVGLAAIAVTNAVARRGGREPKPLSHSLQNTVTLIVAGAGLVGITLGVATVYLLNTATPSHLAAIPESKMTVTQAAEAYLDAAVRHDCWYTHTHTENSTFSWCSDPEMIKFSSVGPADKDPYTTSCAWNVGFAMTDTRASDETIPAGNTLWYFYFTKDNGAWKVCDQANN